MLKGNLFGLILVIYTTLSSGEGKDNIDSGISRRQWPPGFQPIIPPGPALPIVPIGHPQCPPENNRDDGRIHAPNNGRIFHLTCGATKYGRKRSFHEILNKELKVSKRVIGGVPSPEGAWPWTVSLNTGQGHTCGGSLISNRWVLTAAHCIQYYNPPLINNNIVHPCRIKIQIGENTILGRSHDRQVISVNKIIINPSYNPTTLQNDIALLRLSQPVMLGPDANVICLPGIMESYNPATCTIIGWGETHTDSGPSPNLLHLTVGQMHPHQCALTHAVMNRLLLPPGQICINTQPFADSCQGDSGGPMVCKSNEVTNHWVLIGLSSYGMGMGCGLKSSPSVYTDVKFYRSWIEDAINRNGGD